MSQFQQQLPATTVDDLFEAIIDDLSHRRYQGVDWRDVRNWGCNGDMGPTGINHNDGHTLDPYEAMFVKFKGFMLEGDSNSISAGRPHPSAVQAAKYQLWQDQQLMEDDWDKNISGECVALLGACMQTHTPVCSARVTNVPCCR